MNIRQGSGLRIFIESKFFQRSSRKFFVKGIVKVRDLLSVFKDSVKVALLILKIRMRQYRVFKPSTGGYQFELPQGKYELKYG